METESEKWKLALLYVEDEEEPRELIGGSIASEYPDLALYLARDGAEGLELFREHRPAIVVTDILMPVMDGLALAEKIKGLDPETELIALTAYSDTGFLLRAIEIGFSHYVLKPIDYDRLFDAIRKSLNVIELRRLVKEQNEMIRSFVAELEIKVAARTMELQESRDELAQRNGKLRELTGRLKGARDRYWSLYNWAPLGYLSLDGDFIIREINITGAHMLGAKRAELRDTSIEKHLSPENVLLLAEAFQKCTQEEHAQVELEIRLRDAKFLYVQLHCVPYQEEETRRLYRTALVDISRLKEAEQKLREGERLIMQQSRLRELLEHVHLAAFVLDQDGKVTFCNDFLLELTKWRRDEVIGADWFELFVPPEGRERIKALILEGMRKGDVETHFEQPILTKDGERRHMIWDKTLLHSGDAITGIAGIGTDVTEQRSLEEQLRQSQKMEAIGQLAGGIAHDFNNVLTVISGYVTMMQMEAPDDQKEKLGQVLAATEKAANLTRSLLTFSRKQVVDFHLVNLNDVLQSISKFLIRVIGEDIHFRTLVKKDPLMVEIDRGQIEQVLINLAANARDAMSKGGTLYIETDFQHLDELFAKSHGYPSPGPYALITVADTGVGMDEVTQKKAFEPFFTTKEVGKGTGLGLSVVYGIIKQHNGHINIYSELGHGTTFKIYLPASMGEGQGSGEVTAAVPPQRGTETILVAEDDPSVAKMLESILTEYGYQVIVACDGEDVVEKYRANSDAIGMIIMDLIMPKKNGMEAYDDIRQIQPRVKVLFSSGYTADILWARGGFKNDAEVLMKPVHPLELLRKVRSMLDE